MFSERDLVSAVERQLLQIEQTCRGVLVLRAETARPGRRPTLRDRLAAKPAAAAARAPTEGGVALSALAQQAARWRRERSAGAAAPGGEATTPKPPRAAAPVTPPPAVGSKGGDAEPAPAPLALFLSPGKVVFLTVKPRRLAARPEEAVTLSDEERRRHRRLRDCGFAVHVIAAETPADARDQVTALLKRLGLSVNG
jgi:hypothetical protein